MHADGRRTHKSRTTKNMSCGWCGSLRIKAATDRIRLEGSSSATIYDRGSSAFSPVAQDMFSSRHREKTSSYTVQKTIQGPKAEHFANAGLRPERRSRLPTLVTLSSVEKNNEHPITVKSHVQIQRPIADLAQCLPLTHKGSTLRGLRTRPHCGTLLTRNSAIRPQAETTDKTF